MKKLRRDEPCWCGSGKNYGECHADFDRKIETFRKKFHKVPPRSIIKNEYQLEKMRESAKINIAVLDYVGEHIKAGMTTEEIDQMVYEKTRQWEEFQHRLIMRDFQRACVRQLIMKYAMVFHQVI